ncbi:MAG: hypothetical protein AB7P31_14340 [Steroidobacteraceae bacterium]
MVLDAMQDLLAGIYDVPLTHDVRDFLVTDAGCVPRADRTSGCDEQLLVARDGDGMAIALYLDPRVLERLADADPLEHLTAANLADCWTALEGVSHFHYLAFHAGHDHEVSRLELETQAEIDKYVASLWLLRRQMPGHFPYELHRILFGRTCVDPQLPRERAALYRRASHYAARFCRRIEGRLLRPAEEASRDMAAELRRFYRLTESRKLAHIDRCA